MDRPDPRWRQPRLRYRSEGDHLRGARYHRDHVSQHNALAGAIDLATTHSLERDVSKLTVVGYWASSPGQVWREHLPWPVAHDEPQPDENLITGYLLGGYAPVIEGASYRGWSCCRLCGRHNGSSELQDGTYYWPSGLAHYVRYHHVRLPEAFVAHVKATACGPLRPALIQARWIAPLFPRRAK